MKWSLSYGDSRQLIKEIPDKSVDLLLTDIPYNAAIYSTGNISLEGRADLNNDIAEWDKETFILDEWAADFCRILKPTGNAVIFCGQRQIGDFYRVFNTFPDPLFQRVNLAMWHKTNPPPHVRGVSFLNALESIMFMWNPGHTWRFLGQNEMHNVFVGPICQGDERIKDENGHTLHPTQKPLWLLQKIIRIASNPEDMVFDPFAGVASTGEAALKLGRRFHGIERDEKYYNAGMERLSRNFQLALI